MDYSQIVKKIGLLIGELVDYRKILEMKGEDATYIKQLTKDLQECHAALKELTERGKNAKQNRHIAN